MENSRRQFLFPVIILIIVISASVLTACAPGYGEVLFEDDSSGQVPQSNNSSNQVPQSNNPSNQVSESNNPSNQVSVPNNSSNQPADSEGFLKSDCNVDGVTFNNINVGYNVDDIYDGPSLVCSFTGTGSKGLSEIAYFRVGAYKAGPLLEIYQDQQKNIQGFVDQATEWNAQPDVPDSAKDTITFIRDDNVGYIFLITSEANVQGCLNGDGYGIENVDGRYLVQLTFNSCEGDAGSYQTTLENLRNAARAAIRRVEGNAQP
jgi:hypothetical protein